MARHLYFLCYNEYCKSKKNPLYMGINVKLAIFLKKIKKVVDIVFFICYIIRAL